MEHTLYQRICEDILADEKTTADSHDNFIAIEQQDNVSISVYDSMDGYLDGRRYTIRNPEHITKEWLSSIILVSDKAKKLSPAIDKEKVVCYLDALDKNLLMTVRRICFITDEEDEDDSINQDELFSEGIEAGHGINDDQVGITWWDMDVILINLKAIKDVSKELAYDEYEFLREYNTGVLSTLVHEIRHTAQENPYLPEGCLKPVSPFPEEDAEEYARKWVDNHPDYILENRT